MALNYDQLMSGSPPTPQSIGGDSILRSVLLADIAGVVHGITRRLPGLGLADGNIGYTEPRDRADAWDMRQRWMRAAGLDPRRIAVANQSHGHAVAIVPGSDGGKGAEPHSRAIGHADALIVSEPGVIAMTLHADCMPVLLCDPVRRVAATIHAGWRGTVADIAGATVRAMRDELGVAPADIVAYLGPAIGKCCYQVGGNVPEAWSAIAGDLPDGAIEPRGDRWHFDLELANRLLLKRAGLSDDRIERSGLCTKCRGDQWFSHRGQGPATGRFGAFVALSE